MKKFRELSGKLVVAMLAVTLLIGCAIGGTVAWLTAKTDPVVNTFTYGDINIDLWEHAYNASTNALDTTSKVKTVENYKIIPGVNLPKDPTVTVKKDSEACWLFVKVEQQGTFVTGRVTYSIADGWTALTGQTGVYYREVSAAAADTDFEVIKDNTIIVSSDLTKAEINNLTEADKTPKLTFTAYAVQKDGISTAADAWAKVSTSTTTTNP